jgi:hypothetical protein
MELERLVVDNNFEYIQIDTNPSPAPTPAVGQIIYNSDTGALQYNLAGNNVRIDLGLKEVVRCFNAEANTLSKGEVVYIFGAQGDQVSIKRANNASDTTSSKTLGIVGESISSSGTGYVITHGVIDGLNTNSYTAGDILWLSNVAGGLTTIKPTAPNHLVFVGVVIKVNSSSGQIFVKPQNGYELDEIHNVLINSAQQGQVLKFDGSLWVNGRAGIEVSDNAPSSPSQGDLWYESDTGSTFIYYSNTWVEVGAAGEVADGSITTAKLANSAVTTAKLANSAVTSTNIASNTVNWSNLDPTVSYRNILYNGAMQVAQRGTTTATGYPSGLALNGYYTADRWKGQVDSLGLWTQSVENDAPTGSGFRKSLKMLCNTADASPSGQDWVALAYWVEGQDLQAIKKGTSSAQSVTLSFWVKSNVTGTYVIELYDNDNTRHCAKSYSINASGTWEYKTITYPPDTVGQFDNDNEGSLYIRFNLGAGSQFQSGSLATSWASYVMGNRAVGQVNVGATTNNYWQITGVQLNVGAVAAPFEFKSYGRELAECQRYYYRYANPTGNGGAIGYIAGFSSTRAFGTISIPVEMRGAITITPSGCQVDSLGLSNAGNITAVAAYATTGNAPYTTALFIDCTTTGTAAGTLYFFRVPAGASLQFSAEL